MAIQIPNPGTGNGATGDNEFVLWSKVKDNFSNTTHAASRVVGIANGQIPLAEEVGNLSLKKIPIDKQAEGEGFDLNGEVAGSVVVVNDTNLNAPPTGDDHSVVFTTTSYLTGRYLQHAYGRSTGTMCIRARPGSRTDSWSPWSKYYHTGNTTKEEGTGYLVASSPVLKMQHDSFEKVHEAEQLDVEVKNIEAGVYEITGTTGLRENDGWNLKPPKDVNGNVLCICEATEKDGVVTLNTYAKRFDFETVSIVADYDKPINIPEGATVMLRFNDLPLDDTQTEV